MFTHRAFWHEHADPIVVLDARRATSAVPPSVAEVIRRCCQADSSGRWETITEAADALCVAYAQEAGTPHPRQRPRPASPDPVQHGRRLLIKESGLIEGPVPLVQTFAVANIVYGGVVVHLPAPSRPDLEEAERRCLMAVHLLQDCGASERDDGAAQAALGMHILAGIRLASERPREAASDCEAAAGLYERLLERPAANGAPRAIRDPLRIQLAKVRFLHAQAAQADGNLSGCSTLLDQTIAIAEATLGVHETGSDALSELITSGQFRRILDDMGYAVAGETLLRAYVEKLDMLLDEALASGEILQLSRGLAVHSWQATDRFVEPAVMISTRLEALADAFRQHGRYQPLDAEIARAYIEIARVEILLADPSGDQYQRALRLVAAMSPADRLRLRTPLSKLASLRRAAGLL